MRISLEFEDLAALRHEGEATLRRGRALVQAIPGAQVRDLCVLVLIHPFDGSQLEMPSEIVFLDPGEAQMGLAFVDFGPQAQSSLCSFLAHQPPVESPEEELPGASEQGAPTEVDYVAVDPDALPPLVDERMQQAPADPGEAAPAAAQNEISLPSAQRQDDEFILEPTAPAGPVSARLQQERESEVPSSRRARSIYERLRGLNGAQRDKLARSGGLTERTALERLFGSVVWDALLVNPQVSGPEVARIAKNGGAPQPILAVIASNSAWISKPEVRRALLSNPRLAGGHLERVLRALPKTELKQVPKQTAYPAKVRAVAARLLAR